MTSSTWKKWSGLTAMVLFGAVLLLVSVGIRASDLPPLKVVLMDEFPPLIYSGKGAVTKGLIPDRWALWQRKTGRTVEVTAMKWSDALAAFKAGEFDVIDAITTTPERQLIFQFSDPWITLDVVLYYHDSIRGVTDLESASGFQIGAVRGDACVDFMQRQGVDNLALFASYPEVVEAATRGGVSVFCGHKRMSNYYLGLRGQSSQFLYTSPLYSAPGHWAVLKANTALYEEVRQGFALISAAEDKALREKWLGQPLFEPAVPAWILYAALVLLLLLAVVLIWLRMLRRVVDQRTHALAESEERFRMLFENTRQPIALLENGKFIAANTATLDMLAMQRFAELEGKTPLDISPEYQPDGERSAVALLSVLSMAVAKGSIRSEWQHLKADGTPFTVEVMMTSIRRDDRDILHMVWNDITTRKEAERELEAYRNHLEELVEARTEELSQLTQELQLANNEQQALFDSAMAGIVFVRDRCVLRCNRYLEQMLGYESGELLGQTTRSWYPDEQTFFEVGQAIIEAHAERGFFSEERQLVRKDGSRFWARMQAQAVDPDDLSKGLAGMMIDVSAEHAAMEQMAQARQLAEDAARTKADFLANMSHEIRTPMNAIIGMTHLVLQTELNDRQKDYLQKIHRSSKHLLGIINDVLDFSKMDAGKLSLERITFDLPVLITDLTSVLEAKTAEKGLQLKIHIDESLPEQFKGDPLRLQQILLNFANNAVKFTQQGEIEIRVDGYKASAGKRGLQFSVRDTGIGLSPDQQRRLFRSFEQADGSTTRKYGGSGLGLAISRRLAEMMGGEVGVNSQEGKGSTFWFKVELDPVPARASDGRMDTRGAAEHGRQKPAAPGFVELKRQLQGAHILLVEDNPLNQEVAAELLKQVGVSVDVAANGAEALQQLEQRSYDLVLMDMQMPVMDGLTATRRIRRQPQWRDLPILAMTASALAADRKACFEAGMNDFLAKPIEPKKLWAELARWINMRASDEGGDEVVAAATEPVSQALPSVPGLDTETGLKLALGDPQLYRQLLHSFVRSHREFKEQIDQATEEGDLDRLVRLAHTLKGSAAQVGATELSNASRHYEQALQQAKTDALPIPALPDALQVELAQLLQNLAVLFDQSLDGPQQNRAASKAVNREWTEQERELYHRLQSLLATDDFNASRLLADESRAFQSLLGSQYGKILAAVQAFDFEQAGNLLQAAGEKR
jgi:two-component system sensor histidine kinase/response regulator